MEETEIEEIVWKAIIMGAKLGEAKLDLAVAVEMGRRAVILSRQKVQNSVAGYICKGEREV